jgi:hypothetical protein
MGPQELLSPDNPAQDGAPAGKPRKTLTVRAFLVAMVLVFIATVLCDYHDGNITHFPLSMQNYMAPLMTGLMFLFLLAMNPLLHRISHRISLSGGELALVMTLSLMVAPMPRYTWHNLVGTIGYTPAMIDVDHRDFKAFRKANIFLTLPDQAMLTLEQSKQFAGSLGLPGHPVSPLRVPWSAWLRPLAYWAPLMGAFLVFSVSLGYVIYKQWAQRELVPFPLAEFAASLVRKRDGRAWPDVFHERSFWVGLSAMVVIFTMLGLHTHFEKMVFLPTKFTYFDELSKLFAFASGEGYSLLRGTIYFTIVAVAFLLPSEISFTAWFTWPIFVGFTFAYFAQTGTHFENQDGQMMNLGSCYGLAALILYAGRYYYWNLVKAALGVNREDLDSQSIWVARVFMASVATLVAALCFYGLPLDLAVLWVLGLSVMFLVICRLVAEMGIPWTPLAHLSPLSFLTSAIGATGMGAKVCSLLGIFDNLMVPAKTSNLLLSPGVTNAAHVEARVTGGNPSLKVVAPFMIVVLILCIGTLIYLGYCNEDPYDDLHRVNELQKDSAKSVLALISATSGETLTDQQKAVEIRKDVGFIERWSAAEPKGGWWGALPRFWWLFLLGFAMVLSVGYMRLKLPRFPLHPLPLLLMGTWLMSRYWWSFLIGWLLKKVVLRIGGSRLFEKSRPFFTGIIVGQAAVCLLWVVINIFIFWDNALRWVPAWDQFMRDIYSS